MKFTQRHAHAIAKKLDADIEQGSKHCKVKIRHQGSLVASYNIRRASHEIGHDYIPKQLHVSMKQASSLFQCSLDKDSYFSILGEQGWLNDGAVRS
jgi:hypothetical protein